MQRRDIVLQQRHLPLLNELLFQLLETKPCDPLEYLIETLEKISVDVVTARGRLIDVRRQRKQLTESLVKATRQRKPVFTTLLLHAASGRCPIIDAIYHDETPVSFESPSRHPSSTSAGRVVLAPLSAAKPVQTSVDSHAAPSNTAELKVAAVAQSAEDAAWDVCVEELYRHEASPSTLLAPLYALTREARQQCARPALDVLLVAAARLAPSPHASPSRSVGAGHTANSVVTQPVQYAGLRMLLEARTGAPCDFAALDVLEHAIRLEHTATQSMIEVLLEATPKGTTAHAAITLLVKASAEPKEDSDGLSDPMRRYSHIALLASIAAPTAVACHALEQAAQEICCPPHKCFPHLSEAVACGGGAALLPNLALLVHSTGVSDTIEPSDRVAAHNVLPLLSLLLETIDANELAVSHVAFLVNSCCA